MCGIAGWIDWTRDLTGAADIVEAMTETLAPRGPDASGTWLSRSCAFGHRRLCVIDPAGGAQPMIGERGGRKYVIVYNGELYNTAELRAELEARGHRFRTRCDTEVVLLSFIEWGDRCVERLNGIFAFAVWDNTAQRVFLARDRLGVKPLFYVRRNGMLLFASEPKALLAHPSVKPEIDAEGLAEIIAIGPARTPGHGVYRGVRELRPGFWLAYSRDGCTIRPYWRLTPRPHEETEEETAEHVRWLLADTVRRQLVSDVPVCTLLSGGLDSSTLTALAAETLHESGGGPLRTFSVDYADNDRYFRPGAFQPDADTPWIERAVGWLGTEHRRVVIDTPELVAALDDAVAARDLPGMADIDASLLLFCREIKKNATVALSGEAADEVFGGYPWFFREDAQNADAFPWSLNAQERFSLWSPDVLKATGAEEYAKERYSQALAETPRADWEDEEANRIRVMSYLNITRFMPTLLDRKDRMSMACGLEVRVPFCDHRLVEYVWNIPWPIRTAGNREKGILRKAMRGVLPDDMLARKKSPYPKTHRPDYAAAVRRRLAEVLDDPNAPIVPLLNVPHVRRLVAGEDPQSDESPFFGQLMTGPQTLAYLLQVNTWMKKYRVRVVL